MNVNAGQDLSKKPEDSDFQQQRLRAWQPLLTPSLVISSFLVIGIIFIPIGVAILFASNGVVEQEFRYDNDPRFASASCQSSSYTGASRSACSATFSLQIASDMNQPVFFYYKLTNYYQNHRRYVQSKSDAQLRGDSSPDTATCDPLTSNGNGTTYFPCGLIAYSIFNDTFFTTLYRNNVTTLLTDYQNSSTPLGYTLKGAESLYQRQSLASNPRWQKTGIAWSTDVSDKYVATSTSYSAGSVTTTGPNGVPLPRVTDEDFMVWMRTAGLPTFRKLYRKINYDLKAGDILSISISNTYPVSAFNGQKSVVISTASWMGGKNDFLGYAYIVVGALCIFLSIVFGIKHAVSPRQPGDLTLFNRATD